MRAECMGSGDAGPPGEAVAGPLAAGRLGGRARSLWRGHVAHDLGHGLGARPSNRRGLEERAQTREMCGPELKLAGAESSGVTIAAWSECSPSLKIFPSQPVR
jgi:hypothetical protein